MRAVFGAAATGIVWIILILVFVLSPTLGSASSVPALLLGLTLIPVLWWPEALANIRRAPTQMIFVGVVVALTIVFALTARKPGDVLFFANFLAMPLSALLFVIALARQGRAAAVIMARLCLCGAMVGLGFAFYDLFVRGLPRAQGLIGNPNLMPRLVLPLAFVALSGIFVDTGIRRWLYLLAPLAGIVTTVLTGSRGAALAIPALLLIAASFMLRDRQTRMIAIVGGALVVVAGLATLTLEHTELVERFMRVANSYGAVFTGDTTGDAATDERLGMYNAGLAAFLQSPWIGWGWANLGNAAAAIRPEIFAGAAGTAFMFHNDAVNFGVAGGVVGLLCLLALLVAPTIGALASPRDNFYAVRLYCCLQLSVGFAIFGLTDSTLGYDMPTTLYAFLAAIVLGAFRKPVAPSEGLARG